ncbi:uncharacterized protein LOC125034246 isoform X2 [Penaeus chinensis]|uniref:uncharacterized protein LOC125034246 isoform X2 n=1 Tax=Penaeus chinensis TaxID=139456 RepID=UPI001FB70E00|nr:uncharacterized protein LOC125034246 isoform X2 [Penaeus chinensis]
MAAQDQVASRILHRLDESVLPSVKRNAAIVKDFADLLQGTFSGHVLLRGATVMHGGSAYESLCVKKDTDFDITVVLGDPYVARNFELTRDTSGFFALKWRSSNPFLSDKAGFLDAKALQQNLFDALGKCVGQVRVSGTSVSWRPQLAALLVEITTQWGTISMDLVPVIAARSWGPCPDLVPLSSLPATLREHVDTLVRNCSPVLSFSAAAPGNHSNGHRLCNIAFGMLEKNFLRANPEVRDMVRLLKFLSEYHGWKKLGLKSFHLKRMAVKYSAELKDKTLWQGSKILLLRTATELQSKSNIDGFFVRNQHTFAKRDSAAELSRALRSASAWDAAMLATAHPQ